MENCQLGFFLAYESANGRALLDRELYGPKRERMTEKGPRQVRTDQLVSGIEESAWVRRGTGNGAEGPGAGDCPTVIKVLRGNPAVPLRKAPVSSAG